MNSTLTSGSRTKEPGTVDESLGSLNKLRVATATHTYYINVNEIVRIQSISNYSKLFLSSGQTLIVSKVLARYDEILTGGHFFRIHRTHLVNLVYLKNYLVGSATKIGLCNDEILPVSRRKKKVLKEKMMLLSL